jgi:hypothetical protein
MRVVRVAQGELRDAKSAALDSCEEPVEFTGLSSVQTILQCGAVGIARQASATNRD